MDHRPMTVAIVFSRALSGVHAPLVTVEVHLANGLPAFNLVGLPEAEVKGSRERVRAELQNAQVGFPARRTTVNLAPPNCRRSRAASTCRSRSAPWSPLDNCQATGCTSMNSVHDDGTCWLGGAVWHGMAAMRISIVNWATSEADIDRSAAAIIAAARRTG